MRMGVKIVVDGKMLRVNGEQNLLAVCLSSGLDVPYFCWHPALGSVGSCRQCAVKLFRGPADAAGQVVMACMTRPVIDMRVSIADPEAVAFREAAVEMVLTNHPHDCPVCEVGGECHLQDMAVLTGHHERRYRFAKRTHPNQYLGPFIRQEMNRCIGCYRCVRFYQDYAGGNDFGVFGANRNVVFGRAEEGVLESAFAGNLVEVCPTGVFVDKPFSAKFRRKWDMRATPSLCPHCAVGCNITLQERGGEFRRVVNRYNETLNGYFLCDRGRFGAGFLESTARLRRSRDRSGAALSHGAARDRLAAVLRCEGVIGIGSARASVEANFALRALVGAENFYAGGSTFEASASQAAVEILQTMRLATLKEAETADAVLVLGDDPAAVAPRLALALHQAARRVPAEVLAARDIPEWDENAARHAASGAVNPFVVATTEAGWLDDVATRVVRYAPLAFALALVRQIEGTAPPGEVALALLAAKQPVVVAGGDAALLRAGANVALALRRAGVAARLSLMLPEANSVGLGLMDTRPFSEALAAGRGRDVVVLERDVFREAGGAQLFADANGVCVLDHVDSQTVQQADIALAVGSFADCDGSFVNLEGRVQRFFKAIFGADDPPSAWALLRDAGVLAGRLEAEQWPTHHALLAALGEEIPALADVARASPEPGGSRPATLPHRHSGRAAAQSHLDVREAMPPQHEDSALGTTMEGPPVHAQTGVRPVLWEPGWNSGQAVNKGPARGTEEVFLFDGRTERIAYFDIGEPCVVDDRVLGVEALSELSPAIIARRQVLAG